MTRRADLARLLETAPLERVVPRLRAETLHQLIHYRGLEASGELLAAATPEQLSSVVDVDLWRRVVPGGDERFDPDRFGEWLETLAETGDEVAARVVSAMDERLVIAGLSRHIRVFDPAARDAPWLACDDASEHRPNPFDGPEAEVGGYLVIAGRSDAWDAIVPLLLALEAGHHPFFERVMRGCRALSNSAPEADGFHDLPSAPTQWLRDLSAARQARRAAQGYLSTADARLVLDLARKRGSGAEEAVASIERIAAHQPGRGPEAGPQAGPETASAGIDRSADALVGVLAAEGLVAERPRALLAAPAGDAPRAERLRALMARLRDADGDAREARGRELAFLANAITAGCSVQNRPFTPQEASDAVVAACNLGLEEWGPQPAGFLEQHGLFPVFHAGWSALHEMSLAAADRLVAVLDHLRCTDLETQAGLHVLRQQLAKQRAAGAPWRARDALDVIAVLDLPAWVSLLGVLDECPILPAALRATIERRTGSISATAFEFISTRAQVDEVWTFLSRLEEILSA